MKENCISIIIGLQDGIVKECIVLTDHSLAFNLYHEVQDIYGKENTAFVSREVNSVPLNIVEHLLNQLGAEA